MNKQTCKQNNTKQSEKIQSPSLFNLFVSFFVSFVLSLFLFMPSRPKGAEGEKDAQSDRNRHTETKTETKTDTDRQTEADSKRSQTDTDRQTETVCLLVGCLTTQQHDSVSQGRICSDNFTCCHTEIEVADFYLTQSQYIDTGPTSPSADPITPGAWQGSHWSANFWVTGMTRPRKNPGASGIRTWDLPLSRRTPYH